MWNKTISVIIKELKDLFREKRTIFMTIILPAILMPALLIGMFHIQNITIEKESTKTSIIAIEKEDFLAKHYMELLQEKNLISTYIEVTNIPKAIKEGKATIGLKIKKEKEYINIYIYYNVEKSHIREKIQHIANIIKEYYVAEYLQNKGLPPINILSTVIPNPIGDPLATAKSMTGYLLGLFLVMFTTIGNTYLGADIGAGEKERGTLLPLLASPADRKAIATGKWLALSITNLISASALLAGEGFAIWYMISHTGDNMNTSISNFIQFVKPQTIIMLFVAAILLALFGAAVELIISMWSKTLREAQLYLGQLGLLIFLPAMTIIPTMLSGGKLALWAFCIPIVNTMAIVYAAVMNQLSSLYILISFGINILIAAIVVYFVTKILDMEQVILRM